MLIRALDERVLSILESVLLIAGGPVPVASLARACDVPSQAMDDVLAQLGARLTGGIRLQVHDNQAQLVTAPENAEAVHHFLGTARPSALSRPALEALATIAYRQPVTRADVEAARGVNSDRAIQTLLARGLIEERGRRESPGRAVEYGTTFAFLEYFGLATLNDLPPLESTAEGTVDPADLGMTPSADSTKTGTQAAT